MSTVRSNQGDVASTTSASSYASTVLVHSSSSQSQQHQHQQPIPQQRQVAFVERLIFNFEGSVGHNALFLADVDNDGCIEFVIGSVWGTLSIFKFRGSNPYFSCSGLGSISCILVDKVGTRKTNVLCVVSAEGEAHFFDLTSRTTTTTTTTTTTATASASSHSNSNKAANDTAADLPRSNTGNSTSNNSDNNNATIEIKPFLTHRVPTNITSMTVMDIDGDGNNEVIFGSNDRHIYVYALHEKIEGTTISRSLIHKAKCTVKSQVYSLSVHKDSEKGFEYVLIGMAAGGYAALVPSSLRQAMREEEQEEEEEEAISYDDGTSPCSSGIQSEAFAAEGDARSPIISNNDSTNTSNDNNNNKDVIATDQAQTIMYSSQSGRRKKSSHSKHRPPGGIDTTTLSFAEYYNNLNLSQQLAPDSATTTTTTPLTSASSAASSLFVQVPSLCAQTTTTSSSSSEDGGIEIVDFPESEDRGVSLDVVGSVKFRDQENLAAFASMDGVLQVRNPFGSSKSNNSSNRNLWIFDFDQEILGVHRADFTGDGNHEICVCTWDGVSYVVDQDKNVLCFNLKERVSAFCAGTYSLSETEHALCMFYVTFRDKIFAYYDIKVDSIPTYSLKDVLSTQDTTTAATSSAVTTTTTATKPHLKPRNIRSLLQRLRLDATTTTTTTIHLPASSSPLSPPHSSDGTPITASLGNSNTISTSTTTTAASAVAVSDCVDVYCGLFTSCLYDLPPEQDLDAYIQRLSEQKERLLLSRKQQGQVQEQGQ